MTAQPSDKSYANQRKAATILEPLLATQPDHPGVAHYLIHSYDYPSLASGGLEAARRFAAIAPSAPHALHMPAHIFTTAGLLAGVDCHKSGFSRDRQGQPRCKLHAPNTGFVDALHAMDYMMYAYLQSAQDDAAQTLLDEISSIEQVDAENLGSAYALAAIPCPLLYWNAAQWAEAKCADATPGRLCVGTFPAGRSRAGLCAGVERCACRRCGGGPRRSRKAADAA